MDKYRLTYKLAICSKIHPQYTSSIICGWTKFFVRKLPKYLTPGCRIHASWTTELIWRATCGQGHSWVVVQGQTAVLLLPTARDHNFTSHSNSSMTTVNDGLTPRFQVIYCGNGKRVRIDSMFAAYFTHGRKSKCANLFFKPAPTTKRV